VLGCRCARFLVTVGTAQKTYSPAGLGPSRVSRLKTDEYSSSTILRGVLGLIPQEETEKTDEWGVVWKSK